MRKTIVTLDIDDIFALFNQSNSKLFSSIRVAVDKNLNDAIKQLCFDLDKELAKNQYKVRQDGQMIMRIILPVVSEITMAELNKIASKIQKYNPRHFAFGVESDDSTDQLTVDLMFDVDNHM